MTEDDGLRPRWLTFSVLATALIVAILLLVPTSAVSYKAAPVTASTTVSIAVSTSTEDMVATSTEPVVPIYDAETERILYAIGMCESGGQQFRPDGSVVKNPYSSATGKYQLMASIWRPVGLRMGHDIDTEAGNKAVAYYILTEAQGIQAWKASASCLAKYNIFI